MLGLTTVTPAKTDRALVSLGCLLSAVIVTEVQTLRAPAVSGGKNHD